jgi:hypothetical protein
VKLNTLPHLVPRSRMNGAVTPLSNMFSWRKIKKSYLYATCKNNIYMTRNNRQKQLY